jgi:anti-sigma factor RsiW
MTKSTQSPVSSDDLHAYADGQLASERMAEIEVYLARHPDAARQVEDYRALDAALHSSFDHILDEPIPSAHVDRVLHRRRRLAVPFAAALAGLVVGAAGGWIAYDSFGRDELASELLAERARTAYAVYAPEVRHPVEVFAKESGHLATWLSNRMGMTFRIPQLADLGFTLVGGRLMIGERAPAALLMYENGEGQRLILYVLNDLERGSGLDMRYERSGETGVVYWIDDAKGFGLSGGVSESELRAAAAVVRAQYAS